MGDATPGIRILKSELEVGEFHCVLPACRGCCSARMPPVGTFE